MDKWLLSRIMILVPLVLSLTVHEWAHAWSAKRLGDDTAERMGRLTLNPIPHIDLFGTILLPLLNIPFGWAKPVPVNPSRFRPSVNMRTGMMLTAAAGPISNLVLALLCAVLFGLWIRFHGMTDERHPLEVLLLSGLSVNVGLAIFNLLPIPPLDGSRIADRFVPAPLAGVWGFVTQYSSFFLLGVIILSNMGRLPIITWPIEKLSGLLHALILLIASV